MSFNASVTKLTSTRLIWDKTHRLINSSYPPIDLFEDIADPHDWDLLCAAESKTNPRINDSVGNLDLVPPNRRVSGKGASAVMAPFTHISEDWKGRFHNGTYGVYYAANSFETALFEIIHHRQHFFATTQESAGWMADQRELVGRIDHDLVDIRDNGTDGSDKKFSNLLDKNDYSASQAFALNVRNSGHDGIVYPSVRHLNDHNESIGECIAAFYPDVVGIPKQGKHIGLHWDGKRIDKVRVYQASQNLIYEIRV